MASTMSMNKNNMSVNLGMVKNASGLNLAEQPTVFSKLDHPTYVNDLQKVSKFVPVSSYASLSTMAGSVKAGDSVNGGESVALGRYEQLPERKNSLTLSSGS